MGKYNKLKAIQNGFMMKGGNISSEDIEMVWDEAQKERDKLWIDKFDKYACIKNDKWYLDFKRSLD